MYKCPLCQVLEKALECVKSGLINPTVPFAGGPSDKWIILMLLSFTREWRMERDQRGGAQGSPSSSTQTVDTDTSPRSVLPRPGERAGPNAQTSEEERRQNGQWRWTMKRMRPVWRMCDTMLEKLMTHEYAQHFVHSEVGMAPVSLSEVKEKLDSRLYFSPLTFYAELRQVFGHFTLHPSCRLHSLARYLQAWGEKMFSEIDKAIEEIVEYYDPNEESETEDD